MKGTEDLKTHIGKSLISNLFTGWPGQTAILSACLMYSARSSKRDVSLSHNE